VICLFGALLCWCGIWWLIWSILIASHCTTWSVASLIQLFLSMTKQRWIKQASLFKKKCHSNPLKGQEHVCLFTALGCLCEYASRAFVLHWQDFHQPWSLVRIVHSISKLWPPDLQNDQEICQCCQEFLSPLTL
jgi:hypothetical protein